VKVGALNTALYSTPRATAADDPEAALVKLIDGARATLLIGIYSVTLAAVADAVIAAAARGVSVTVATDATEAVEVSSQIKTIAAAGIPVHIWGSEYHLAHFKVAVADGKTVAVGSFNFSTEAEDSDYEIFAVFTGVQVTRGAAAFVSNLITACFTAGTPYVPPTPAGATT
jgi:phosphatidylserine/phosphatidylglycerophosphate/cardiolipin synthase-like enzyme